jgi:hypothetical protein
MTAAILVVAVGMSLVIIRTSLAPDNWLCHVQILGCSPKNYVFQIRRQERKTSIARVKVPVLPPTKPCLLLQSALAGALLSAACYRAIRFVDQ